MTDNKSDDELLALARKADDNGEKLVVPPIPIIAMIERHRAEVEAGRAEVVQLTRAFDADVERLTRERDALLNREPELIAAACCIRNGIRLNRYNDKECTQRERADTAESALAAAQQRIADAVAIIDGAHRQRCSGYLRCCDQFYHARDIDGVRAALAGKDGSDAVACARYILSLAPGKDVVEGARRLLDSIAERMTATIIDESCVDDVVRFASEREARAREDAIAQIITFLRRLEHPDVDEGAIKRVASTIRAGGSK